MNEKFELAAQDPKKEEELEKAKIEKQAGDNYHEKVKGLKASLEKANTVVDLSEIIDKSSNSKLKKLFNKSWFDYLRENRADKMNEYAGFDSDGFLLNEKGEKVNHVTAIDTVSSPEEVQQDLAAKDDGPKNDKGQYQKYTLEAFMNEPLSEANSDVTDSETEDSIEAYIIQLKEELVTVLNEELEQAE